MFLEDQVWTEDLEMNSEKHSVAVQLPWSVKTHCLYRKKKKRNKTMFLSREQLVHHIYLIFEIKFITIAIRASACNDTPLRIAGAMSVY